MENDGRLPEILIWGNIPVRNRNQPLSGFGRQPTGPGSFSHASGTQIAEGIAGCFTDGKPKIYQTPVGNPWALQ